MNDPHPDDTDPKKSDAESGPAEESSQVEEAHTRRQRRAARGDTSGGLLLLPFIAAGGIVIILTFGLVWWLVLREPPVEETPWEWNANPGMDGIHARDVPPEDWEEGWCLVGYEGEETEADVIDCDQRWDAQVMLRRDMEQDSWPGDEIVIETAHRWCHDELELNPEATAALTQYLRMELRHPVQQTWNREDDRLISCFLTAADGGQLTGDFTLDTAATDTGGTEGGSSDVDADSPDQGADVDVVEEPRQTEPEGEDPSED
ncbi:hypothetical protein [Nesterenkonia flava]|uniref:Septum formation-related domain-containing protein n=1 Tax=Nesterenkonia flava TaxID=469799 RepID=A0ABU1FTR8_9MICC|nr:hypothetical protein [Nesterenkonia flava]MDR5711573.1 hypothetical protein [Nesterenkonia flava]